MIFKFCQTLCQPIQTTLESAVPGIPDDAVWGVVKNSAYFFTASVILTKGNYSAGKKSALLAVIATVIYALIVAFLNWLFGPGEKSDTTKNIQSFFITGGVIYWVSEKTGPKMGIMVSIIFTGLPYTLGYPPTAPTPLFGTIVV